MSYLIFESEKLEDPPSHGHGHSGRIMCLGWRNMPQNAQKNALFIDILTSHDFTTKPATSRHQSIDKKCVGANILHSLRQSFLDILVNLSRGKAW